MKTAMAAPDTPPDGSNSTESGERAHFRFMDLPAELRLMVYDNITIEVRRVIPFSQDPFYYQDFDDSLLRVSKDIRREATSIIQTRMLSLNPSLTFGLSTGTTPFEVYSVLDLFDFGREMELRGTATACQIEGIKDIFARRSHTHAREARAFYSATMRRLRNNPMLEIRRLLRVGATNWPVSHRGAFIWGHFGQLAVRALNRLRFNFSFVVKPEHQQQCEALTAQPGFLPVWLTKDMWKIEVTEGGLDPAVD